MTVRRTLPHRHRHRVGPWCFIDHYGPDEVHRTGGMLVPPHPHLGLTTVAWLYEGRIEHRDSLGTLAEIRPGEVNLMTAGAGISHSEVSTPQTRVLHGVQLWLELPGSSRSVAPRFEQHTPSRQHQLWGSFALLIGEYEGVSSPVVVESATLALDVQLHPGAETELALDPAHEHAILVDDGAVVVDGHVTVPATLALLEVGASRVRMRAGNRGARMLLLGGEPLAGGTIMWWNFLAGTDGELRGAREEWMRSLTHGEVGRFGTVSGWPASAALPAPEMPALTLRAPS